MFEHCYYNGLEQAVLKINQVLIDHNIQYITYIIYSLMLFTVLSIMYLKVNKKPSVIVIILSFLIVFLSSLPNFLVIAKSIDESQHIAEAKTLFNYPIFWLSVDGTTIGPTPLYLLTVFQKLGIPIDFTTVKMINLLLWLIIVIFIHLTIRKFLSHRSSTTISFLFICLIASFHHVDYISYNGEILTVLILSLVNLLIFKVLATNKPGNVYQLIIGFLLILACLSKIQIGPAAFITGLYLLVILIYNKRSYISLLIGVGLGISILLIYTLIYTNTFFDFWQSYIINNLEYYESGVGLEGNRSVLAKLVKTFILLFKPVETRHIFILAISSFLFLIISLYKKNKKRFIDLILIDEWSTSLILIQFITILYVVYLPGNMNFIHYLIFLIYPSILLISLSIKHISIRDTIIETNGKYIIIIFLAFTFVNAVFESDNWLSKDNIGKNQAVKQDPIIEYLCEHKTKNDRLATWGWSNVVYVLADINMGTREAHTQRQIFSKKQKDYYIDRFYKDLINNKPRFFIDSTERSPFFDFEKHNFNNNPKIASYVNSNYKLIKNHNGWRLYERTVDNSSGL